MGAINSLNAMRTIGRNLHSWVVPQEVSVADAGKMFDEDGSLKDPALDQPPRTATARSRTRSRRR